MDTILHPTQDYNWVGNAEGGRMSVWKRGIGYMVDHPLTGVGAGAFSVAEGTISPLAKVQEYGVGTEVVGGPQFVRAGWRGTRVSGPRCFSGSAVCRAWPSAARGGAGTRRSVTRRAAAMGDALAASLVGFAVSGFFLSEGYSAYVYSVSV